MGFISLVDEIQFMIIIQPPYLAQTNKNSCQLIRDYQIFRFCDKYGFIRPVKGTHVGLFDKFVTIGISWN